MIQITMASQTIVWALMLAVASCGSLGLAKAEAASSTDRDKVPAEDLAVVRSADAFNASGTISSLNNGKILAGHWSLRVVDGNISQFQVNFSAVSIDGENRSQYLIRNSEVPAVVPVLIDSDGSAFPLAADISNGSRATLHSIQPHVTIAKLDVLKIAIDDERWVSDFGSRPIYGVVDSIQIKPPGPP